VLPQLFNVVTIPDTVYAELLHPGAPQPVRDWCANPPSWFVVSAAPIGENPPFPRLDPGERAAIDLALALRADLLLIDDRAGATAAAVSGLNAIGTIGLLDRAASRGLIEIGPAVARLKATNFRYRPQLLDAVVAHHRKDARP
jgi:predicted nucleic acid-binding protein